MASLGPGARKGGLGAGARMGRAGEFEASVPGFRFGLEALFGSGKGHILVVDDEFGDFSGPFAQEVRANLLVFRVWSTSTGLKMLTGKDPGERPECGRDMGQCLSCFMSALDSSSRKTIPIGGLP